MQWVWLVANCKFAESVNIMLLIKQSHYIVSETRDTLYNNNVSHEIVCEVCFLSEVKSFKYLKLTLVTET